MSNAFPKNNFDPGWPEFLTDVDGNHYVRVRDGSPTSAFGGNSCLYARLDSESAILRTYLYTPRLISTPESVLMASGSWLTDEEAAKAGVPPIKLPPEPVQAQATRTRSVRRGFPERNYDPGWPAKLTDVEGQRYVRLRDGSATSAFGGNSCLYGKLDAAGKVLRDRQYVPALGSSPESVIMLSGPWMSVEDAKAAGVPPIVLPSGTA